MAPGPVPSQHANTARSTLIKLQNAGRRHQSTAQGTHKDQKLPGNRQAQMKKLKTLTTHSYVQDDTPERNFTLTYQKYRHPWSFVGPTCAFSEHGTH